MWQPIYEPRGPAYEYCHIAVGIYTGCPHRCSYCYVPGNLRIPRETFHADVRPRALHGLGIVDAVARQLSKPKYHGKGLKIMLSFTCDPYPLGHDSTATREVIKAIKDSGNHVSILTKGDQTARRDFDLLDSNDLFGVSWTGGGDCEPGAAPHWIRQDNLAVAKIRGIRTWISCEPVIDPEWIYTAIAHMDFVDIWRIGKLNHRRSNIDWGKFGRTAQALCRKHGREFYIKDDLQKAMGVDYAI